MKLATVHREVETNLTDHQAFRMGSSAKMFAILADKIYTDKPRAVIREICCNALDAHTAAGRTDPFWVSLPSKLEPMLAIRDFGASMTHDEIMGLYTTFFDSSKTGDNDQIGGFGLGSKSPFAYTDAFTVVAIQNGEKRVYAAFRGEDGVPQMALAEREDTDEPDGTEVRVPVRERDLIAFRNTAQDVLSWFPVGSYKTFGVEVTPVQPSLQTDTWMLLPNIGYQHKVLMGPVAYRLDWSMVDPEIDLPSSVVPIFGIGELDLPPSREQLSYDPATIAKLKARAKQLTTEIPPLLADRLYAAKPIERLQLIKAYNEAGMGRLFKAWHESAGHKAEEDELKKEWEEKGKPGSYYKPKWGTYIEAQFERIYIPAPASLRHWRRGNYRTNAGIDRQSTHLDSIAFEPHAADQLTNAWFIWNDMVGHHAPRILARLEELPQRSHYYLVSPSEKVPDLATLKGELHELSDDHFRVLSEIPLPPKAAKPKGELRVWSRGKDADWCTWYPVPDEGLWTPVRNGEPENPVVNRLITVGWTEERIWGFSQRAQKELLDDDWTRFEDWVAERVRQALASPVIVAALHAERIYEKLKNDRLFVFANRRAIAGMTNLLPSLVAAITAMRADALLHPGDRETVHRLLRTEALGLVSLPPLEDRHGIEDLVKVTRRRNKNLDFVLKVGGYDLGNNEHHDADLLRLIKRND